MIVPKALNLSSVAQWAEIIGLGTIFANPFIITFALVTMRRATWAVCGSTHAK